jgi:hypothetical protein
MKFIIESAKLYSKQVYVLAQQSTSILEKMQATDDKLKAADLYTQAMALQPLIVAAKNSINTIMTEDAKKHGGTLNIVYTYDQSMILDQVKKENPGFESQAMPTYNARMYFSIPTSIAEGVDPSLLPFIRTYSVGGVPADKLATSPAQIAPALSVTVALTKIGACMLQYPAKFGSDAKPQFAMTVLYQYPYMFRKTVKAKYNLLSIYKRIQESGTKGGFFSSESYSSLVESNWGESAFDIDWADNDPESKITVAERLEIQRTIKADLLANLDTLITQKTNLPTTDAPNPGPRGATVLAEGLEKTCAANGYCAAAAVAFRVLDAVFGSSSMSSTIEKTLNVAATYELNEGTTRYVTQGVTYAK